MSLPPPPEPPNWGGKKRHPSQRGKEFQEEVKVFVNDPWLLQTALIQIVAKIRSARHYGANQEKIESILRSRMILPVVRAAAVVLVTEASDMLAYEATKDSDDEPDAGVCDE